MSEILTKRIPKELYPVHPATIKFKTSFKNCISKALKNRGWKETENDNDWTIYWAEKETTVDLLERTHVSVNQRINHFRNHYELTRKDLLMRNLKKVKRQFEKEGKTEEATKLDFFPITYNLPSDYPIFCEEFKRCEKAIWIMKPIGKSQGKGIFLFNKLNQISNWNKDNKSKSEVASIENYIVQRYISNPLLIGGKKFDMRIYCLVTSFNPLKAYLYRDGFARFTHHRYSNHDLNNTYLHLTNVAIQKNSENYDEKLGGKWDLRNLKQYFVTKFGHAKTNSSFTDIQKLVINTLKGIQKNISSDKFCFELYGFDVLLDDEMKPWLLEVNGSPSMTANTEQDAQLKCNLLDDTFTILDIEKILSGQEERIGGFDLIVRDGTSKSAPFIRNDSTMLGCKDDRERFYSLFAKQIVERLSHPNRIVSETKRAFKISRTRSDKAPETIETQASISLLNRSIEDQKTCDNVPTERKKVINTENILVNPSILNQSSARSKTPRILEKVHSFSKQFSASNTQFKRSYRNISNTFASQMSNSTSRTLLNLDDEFVLNDETVKLNELATEPVKPPKLELVRFSKSEDIFPSDFLQGSIGSDGTRVRTPKESTIKKVTLGYLQALRTSKVTTVLKRKTSQKGSPYSIIQQVAGKTLMDSVQIGKARVEMRSSVELTLNSNDENKNLEVCMTSHSSYQPNKLRRVASSRTHFRSRKPDFKQPSYTQTSFNFLETSANSMVIQDGGK